MEKTRGWQLGKSVLECNLHMLESRVACDVQFTVTSGASCVDFPAHKYVLISRSPVFEAMLCGEFNEVSSSVVITDVEADSFYQMLRYLYVQEADISSNNVLPLLFVAKKYMIEGLVDNCITFLRDSISRDNVCTILNHCIMYDETELVQRCLKYLGPRASDILESDGFLQLSKAALLHVVQYDRLFVNSEIDVLTACKRWATQRIVENRPGAHNVMVTHQPQPESRQASLDDSSSEEDEEEDSKGVFQNSISRTTSVASDVEIRQQLGDCLYQIRFSTMTAEEIASAVGSSGILSDEETRLLFCHVTTWQYREELKALRFNVSPRPTTYEYCRRFWQVGSGWNYERDLPDAISFRVDRPIWLMGVSMYGGEVPGDRHEYELDVHNGALHQWVSTSRGSLQTDGTDNPVAILLDRPQRLEPNAVHTVRLQVSGPKTYFGEKGLRVVRQEGLKMTFCSSSESLNETVVSGGQIPEIIYRRV